LTGISSSHTFLIVDNQIFRITQAVTTIGRALGNHIVLTDHFVSRRHAEIRFEGDEFVLYDLDSTGGTELNGEKIIKCVLKNGDCFLLAGIPIVFAHNLPQLGSKAKADTGELEEPGPDNEPTIVEKDLDWRE